MRFANIRHAILDPTRAWDAMDDLTLQGSPFLFHVRLTLRKSLAEHEATICEIVEKAKRGMVPVSGVELTDVVVDPGEDSLLEFVPESAGGVGA